MKLGQHPLVTVEGAWQGFPELSGEERTESMIRLFAEEAMVLVGHHFLQADQQRRLRPCREAKRFALRALITSGLPPAWRYFGVNHYRNIADLIPEDFYDTFSELEDLRPRNENECIVSDFEFSEPKPPKS